MQTQSNLVATETEVVANAVGKKSDLLDKHILKILVANAVITLVITFWFLSEGSVKYDFNKIFLSLDNWYQFCGLGCVVMMMAITVFGGLTLVVITFIEKFESWKDLKEKKTILV